MTVRLKDIDEISKAEATVGGRKVPVTLERLKEEKTTVYFLMDVSGPKGNPLLKAEADTVANVAESLLSDAKRSALYDVGIGTIGEAFVPWGYSLVEKNSRDAVLAKMVQQKKDKPDATAEIYRCTISAIEALKDRKTEGKKVIFLLSSGKTEDTDQKNSEESLAAAANKEGIPLFVIGFSATDAGRGQWQTLRRLASDTAGSFIETPAPKQPASGDLVLKELFGMTNAAKVIHLDLKDAPAGKQTMEVDLELNSSAQPSKSPALVIQREIEVPVVAAPPVVPPTPEKAPDKEPDKGPEKTPDPAPAAVPASTPQPVAANKPAPQGLGAWMAKPWFLPTAVGGGLLLIGLVTFLIVRLFRRPAPEPVTAPTNIFDTAWTEGTQDQGTSTFSDSWMKPETPLPAPPATPAPVLGWLVQVDKGGNQIETFPINKGKITIGRSSDNEVIFGREEDGISVHHATVHQRSDRNLVVTDLRSSNGVYLNDKRVEHSVLKDGDIIELGKVRLKFVLNQTKA